MRATATAVSEGSQDNATTATWSLACALTCDGLGAGAARHTLRGIAEVEIGRGDSAQAVRRGARIRIDVADPVASGRHAVVHGDGERWEVRDLGSKNGTRVNGRRVQAAVLADGDVIECGESFFVLRRSDGAVRDLDAPAGCTHLLCTLSPAFERELAVLPKIARSKVPVLVRGASGVGKDVVAGAIHELSGRRGPLVPVNCGAIPATLVESELFGARRGAFSGAEDRPGLVRGAEGGTLFLDEIAELSAASQAALLRFLQDGEIQPIGGAARVAVDARVIAATHRPIEALVRAGKFRHDLYARLLGYELHLPTLRDRIEDLGLLCSRLLARLAPGAPAPRLSRGAARALFAHPWTMHVRELEQVLRAALATSDGGELSAADLRLAGRGGAADDAAGDAAGAAGEEEDAGRAEPVAGRAVAGRAEPVAGGGADSEERARIIAALEACAGNQTRAAQLLGVSRSTLLHKLRDHRVPRPRAR